MTIQMIPLKNLTLSPANVRKVKTTTAGLEASIASVGLLQNLVVKPNGKAGHFEVIGGKRRFIALTNLVKAGKHPEITDSTEFPCKVDDATTGKEQSLAENFQREAMHPADEFEAFQALIDEGKTPKDIAARFGIKVRDVEKRLALAAVHPKILKSYRAGDLTLDEVMAFTVATSPDRQAEVFDGLGSVPTYANKVRWIKDQLTTDKATASNPLAVFVGIDAYKAAGGTVTTDLFSENDHSYLDDGELLVKLATEKLGGMVQEALADGWAWAHGDLEKEWEFVHAHEQLEETEVKLTKKQQAEIAKLQKRLDALNDKEETDNDDWEEQERLEDQIASLTHAFTPEQKAASGVYLYVERDGTVERVEGLQRPEDAPETEVAATVGEKAPVPQKPVDPADKPLTDALRTDLRQSRNQIMQLYVSRDFGMAFDLLLHKMIVDHLDLGTGILDARVTEQYTRSNVEDLNETPAGQELAALFDALPRDFLPGDDEDQDADKLFDAIRALTPETKQAWFAYLVGVSVKAQLADDKGGYPAIPANPVYERAGALLDIDMPKYFRANPINYFDRINKGQLLKVAAETVSQEWAQSRANAKKGDLSATMGAKFERDPADSRNTPEQQARIDAWVPDVMAFPKAQG